ncbi:calmodulin-regulated spectrin-associated protein 1a isoform X1 [Gadus morhua]|nr:calmodulin-regulated spectrin-associated protein 1-B-like isoform X1 [Gadus morhua]
MDTDILPNHFYDPAKAKIYANLRWLFAKAYGPDGPEDLRELFYVDQYEQEHIKPLVLQLLLSGELYCSVCSLILKGFKTPQSSASMSLHSHQAVLKALLRRGVHVVEADEYVSDSDLSSAPIKMSAHITLIDALMTAYASERVSSDRPGSGSGRFSNPAAFSQGPLDLEGTLISWINKVIVKMREVSDSEQMRKEHLRDSYSYQTSPSKWYWTLVPGRCRDSPEGTPYYFPLVEDLMNNIFTATALLTLIHFYCPALIRLDDICLKEIPPVAEGISNIQLLMAFSNKHLNSAFYLKMEDMLYCPLTLKNNMMAFIAELFWVFEKVKPTFVQPRDSQDMKDGLRTKPSFSACEPQDSILSWTERRKSPVSRPLYHEEPYSLHTPPFEGAGFSLALGSMDPHQTHQGHTTPSLPRHPAGAGLKGLPGRAKAQGLLGHVYISDEENEAEEEELVVIIHPPLAAGQRRDGAPDGGLPHGAFSVDHPAQESFYLEPLVPAVSKPAKEKSVCLNKQDESGESPRGRSNVYTHSSPAPRRPDKLDTESLDLRAPSALISPTQSEPEDKEDNRCPSPCLSTTSQASSSCCSASDSTSVRMTTFADRKLKKKNLRNCGSSPTGSSQKFPLDEPAITFPPQLPQGGPVYPRGDHKSSWQGKESLGGFEKEAGAWSPPAVQSELLQLHMQLVEQQRAIEGQKKKMETVFTQQRLELGKAAFLNVIKKGGGKSDTLPRPLKKSSELYSDIWRSEDGRGKIHPSKDDSCLDEVLLKESLGRGLKQSQERRDKRLHPAGLSHVGPELDVYGFCYSLDNLNKSVSSIQQKIMQLSLQQSRLMKQGEATPTPSSQDVGALTKDPPFTPQTPPAAVSFSIADFASPDDSGLGSINTRSLGRRCPAVPFKRPALTKPTELRLNKEDSKPESAKHSTNQTTSTHSPPERPKEQPEDLEPVRSPIRTSPRGSTFTVACDTKSPAPRPRNRKKPSPSQPPLPVSLVPDGPLVLPPGLPAESDEEDKASSSEKGDPIEEEADSVRRDVMEEDLSEQTGADPSDCQGSEQKNGLLFYKHAEKEMEEDEMAKRRAAFLLKQQRKAEESRLRKQTQEAENELKRDEARLKAEEDRVRKEEEKIRRELIKQEYLQRKQQELLEEQGAVKPRPKPLSARRPRLKSPPHPGSLLPKAPSRDEPSSSQRGSTLSLAGEPDDFPSGRSLRSYSRCSEDSFSVMSVDWDKRSTASFSLTADYNGPKLFKEPTSKSNKSIIINAIAHCCLAGKVNESQKNVVLEELEKCKANHLLILLRDGSCQYRGIYCYLTDTEEIIKFLGTGPRTITRKMTDKLYKYSCDRKQFGLMPTKTLSITVDAVTIHNHLWQVKRKGSLTMKK